jgi:hypothetical protein
MRTTVVRTCTKKLIEAGFQLPERESCVLYINSCPHLDYYSFLYVDDLRVLTCDVNKSMDMIKCISFDGKESYLTSLWDLVLKRWLRNARFLPYLISDSPLQKLTTISYRSPINKIVGLL